MPRLYLSARGFYRIFELACAIADLDAVEMIEARQVAEVIQYRPRGKAQGTL